MATSILDGVGPPLSCFLLAALPISPAATRRGLGPTGAAPRIFDRSLVRTLSVDATGEVTVVAQDSKASRHGVPDEPAVDSVSMNPILPTMGVPAPVDVIEDKELVVRQAAAGAARIAVSVVE